MRKTFLASVIALCLAVVGLSAQQSFQSPPIVVLNNVTTGSSVPLDVNTLGKCRETTIYLNWASGSTAGVVAIETADSVSYAGTWANLTSVTFAGTAPKQDVVQITGVENTLRARVTTTISGGAAPGLTVSMQCN